MHIGLFSLYTPINYNNTYNNNTYSNSNVRWTNLPFQAVKGWDFGIFHLHSSNKQNCQWLLASFLIKCSIPPALEWNYDAPFKVEWNNSRNQAGQLEDKYLTRSCRTLIQSCTVYLQKATPHSFSHVSH